MATTYEPRYGMGVDDSRKPNRLAAEASPYLLQHAHNPVEWWPWCTEALAEARRRDVPILLSIGYSACHWCHVMERESFENASIAARMNEHFVNIKVDREERPDLDQIYQLVVQLMGRTGGWPLTVFLTPEQKPFFGGTYFPPENRYGMPGFPAVLEAISQAYRTRREEVSTQADELSAAIAQVSRGDVGGSTEAYQPGRDLLERAGRALLRRFDTTHAGFGERPKFPNTMPWEVLLRRGVLEDDEAARDAARAMLEAMRRGGIWDHVGGGFHRYSTDERWLVPHFEKMLYDNALLLRAYADGWRVFGAPLFADTVRSIAAYLRREMTSPSGAFYASQDADSDGEEGKFFVWNEAGVRAALHDDELAASVALRYFGVSEEGNFEDHGRPTGMTVLHESRTLAAVKNQLDVTEESVAAAFERARDGLFRAREKRTKPFRDEKVLTSWNALVIGALSEAGAALDDRELVDAAERAMGVVVAKLVVREGDAAFAARLLKDERVKGPGFLDDQAYLANAALDLYEATGEPRHVELARALMDGALARFHEDEGFFFTSKDGEPLIARGQDRYDHAVPSATAFACRALLRLGALVDARYHEIAQRELVRLAPSAVTNPFAFGQVVCELDRLVRGSIDVVLVGRREDDRTRALARIVHSRWIPNRTLAWLVPDDPAARAACAALAEGKSPGTSPVAYVCRDRTCSLPVAAPDELAALLDGLR